MKIAASSIGTDTTIAQMKKKYFTSQTDDSLSRNKPGIIPPKIRDILVERTAIEITTGIDLESNHWVASFDGEFIINIFPNALRAEPSKHKAGQSTQMKLLSQTPAIRMIDPITHPNFIPIESKIQFTGKAQMGWRSEKTRVFKVTIIAEYPNLFQTIELMPEKA